MRGLLSRSRVFADHAAPPRAAGASCPPHAPSLADQCPPVFAMSWAHPFNDRSRSGRGVIAAWWIFRRSVPATRLSSPTSSAAGAIAALVRRC